jgi:hypothetical protein
MCTTQSLVRKAGQDALASSVFRSIVLLNDICSYYGTDLDSHIVQASRNRPRSYGVGLAASPNYVDRM